MLYVFACPKIHSAVLAAGFALFPAFADAADPSPANEVAIENPIVEPLPDNVIVYGLRDQQSSTVGSSVTVITAEDLEVGQFVFVMDALKTAPGVAIARNGGFGGFSSARIRGGSSGQTLVVIDGVNVNDAAAPQGGFNLANLDVADVEQIEILRGPQGLIWGADAIGGVIYVNTKKAAPTFTSYAEGGSQGTFRSGATGFASSGRSRLRGTISGIRTVGVSRASSGVENDGFRSLAASLSADAPLSDNIDIALTARVADSRADLDGFPPPLFEFADTQESENTREYAVSGKISHGRANPYVGALTLSSSGVNRSDFDAGLETFSAKGRRWTAHYWGAYRLSDDLRIAGGAEYERSSAKVSGVDEETSSAAVFAFAEARPFRRLSISAGARRDEFAGFEGATTSRIAGVWAIRNSGRTATRLRASWGQGFRAPTLFELHFDQFGVIPNPDLRPERANGFDAGVELDNSSSSVNFRATYFRQRVKDQIDFDFAGSGYFNIGRVKSEGVEIEAQAPLGEHASARIVYSFIDAKNAHTEARILRTPKHSGVITLAATPVKGLTLSSAATFNGREADFPTANKAFVKLDFRAAYEISRMLEVYGRIENATDADYEDVSGFGEPGLSAFAGARVRL